MHRAPLEPRLIVGRLLCKVGLCPRKGCISGGIVRIERNRLTEGLSRMLEVVAPPCSTRSRTAVNYTAVVLGTAPVIGANTLAISWITATGSVFQTSGPLTDGYIAVGTQ